MRHVLLLPLACGFALCSFGQQITTDAQLIAKRKATEKELESVAIFDRKLMIAMRDGKRMAADVYRPKDTSKKYPIISSARLLNTIENQIFTHWKASAPCSPR